MYLNTTRGLCRTSTVASPVHCRPATRMACSASTSNCGPSCDGDPVERTRQRMNYTNNWHRKPVDESQQVTWDRPLRQDPLVAVIGGGLSGLACAHGLARHGIRSVVFDTGEHSVGGRLGTRSSRDGSLHPDWLPADLAGVDLAFDHAAQCFTATDPRFQAVVDSWVQRGLVRAWHTADQPCVGVLTAPAAVQQPSAGPSSNSSTSSSTRPAGSYQALPADLPLYIATRGMRSLAIDMAEQGGAVSRFMSLQRPMWVSRVAAAPQKGGFQLSGKQKGLGVYDVVVAAHNGKCLNRLLAPVGCPLVAQQVMKLKLSAVWVVMAVFKEPLPVPQGMEGAFISGSPVLSWAANNTAKLSSPHQHQQQQQQQSSPGLQCWTLISTNAFGQRNKVPQEAVPADVAAKVAGELVGELERLLGQQLAAPVFYRCQLWGAALPLNSPKVPALLDPASRVGVCGDWLLGAGMQSAYLSGLALADQIAALRGKDAAAAADLAMGLRTPFEPLTDSEIGEFPGVSTPTAAAVAAGGRGGSNGSRGGRGGGSRGGGRGPRVNGGRGMNGPGNASRTAAPTPAKGGWRSLGGVPAAAPQQTVKAG